MDNVEKLSIHTPLQQRHSSSSIPGGIYFSLELFICYASCLCDSGWIAMLTLEKCHKSLAVTPADSVPVATKTAGTLEGHVSVTMFDTEVQSGLVKLQSN